MKKIVFFIDNRETGGFVTSLSNLYTAIKDSYDIKVVELSTSGSSIVSYGSVAIRPSFLCNGYFSDFTLSKGYSKFRAFVSKVWARVNPFFIKSIVKDYSRIVDDADCVIAFCEGKTTEFVKHLTHPNKVAWIHYDATHYPVQATFCEQYSSFSEIICVADAIADGMRKMYPSVSEKFASIHNIIEKDRIVKMSKSTIEENFDNCFNIISIGRIVELKRYHNIPSIAQEIKSQGILFKWRIIGPSTDEFETKRLLDEITNNDVADCVQWLGEKNNPYPYISKSDVLVSLSETEACPMIFTEARSLDTLIVSTDFPSSKEFVENDVDGVITPLELMSHSLLHLLSDKKYYQSILQGSQKRSSENSVILAKFSKLLVNSRITKDQCKI